GYDPGSSYYGNSPDHGYRSQPNARQTWYYCSNPAGYYPPVTHCNTVWQYGPGSAINRDSATPPHRSHVGKESIHHHSICRDHTVVRGLKAVKLSRSGARSEKVGYRCIFLIAAPLHGISFGLKDICATAAIRTTSHSKICENLV